jgi:Ser/Thr protein kinase RdoA (MazF antagonist)
MQSNIEPFSTEKVPVFSSIIDIRYLENCIANNYSLERVVCNLIHSKMHDVYLVTSCGSNFVFKIYAHGDFSTQKIFHLNETLQKLSLWRKESIQKIISTKSGSPFIIIHFPEGNRFGVMYSYVGGSEVNQKNDLHAWLYGVSMAELHSFRIQEFEVKLQNYKLDFSSIPANISSENIYRLSDIKGCIESHSSVLEKLRISIIHGDCHGGNAIISNERVYFIDFDDMRIDYSAIDLMAYKLVCLTHLGIDRFNKVMEGYLKINPDFIIDEEQEFLLLWERELDFIFRYFKRSEKLGAALINNIWIEGRIKFLKNLIGGI